METNLARLDTFVTQNVILGCDVDTARHYGLIKHQLKIQGRPIPENDLWVAAIAKQYGLTVVTRDEHFNQIGDLSVVMW
jgi:tRNA(fMet)-specific endonuclease VapC